MKPYIYKITINDQESTLHNCFYIGVRVKPSSTPDKDVYWGSSSILDNYYRKRGKSKVIKTIIGIFDNIEDAYINEKLIVDNNLLSDPLCLNRQVGGSGGKSPLYVKPPSIVNINHKTKNKQVYNDGSRHYYLLVDDPRILTLTKGRLPLNDHQKEGTRNPRKAFVRTEEHKQNISKSQRYRNLGFNIHTPWGIFNSYQAAIDYCPAEFIYDNRKLTVSRLKHITDNPDMIYGRGTKLKYLLSGASLDTAPTHRSLGFFKTSFD